MHSIIFKNTENDWENALPLGNGVFGLMAYFKNGSLHLPMNHYEVYYNISENVLPEDRLNASVPASDPGALRRDTIARANRNSTKEDGESFTYYRLDKAKGSSYFVRAFDGSYPQTGEICLNVSNKLKKENTCLSLNIEQALVSLDIDGQLKAEVRILREDAVLFEITGAKYLDSVLMGITPQRTRDMPKVTYMQQDATTFYYVVEATLGKKTFTHSGIVKLSGCEGILKENRIILKKQQDRVKLLTGVFTSWQYRDVVSEGLTAIEAILSNVEEAKIRHQDYWNNFFERSSISLPDKFLEKVYYINQYALDCCSGKNGVMKHHACGLNGLWDIKHPNLWGSMWYWDVNIQAAFAGVFSSNHLDLGKVFSDGLLSYTKLAEKYAKDIHNLDGVALDYPYPFYYSVWPWCAHYLWAYYEYSLDEEYLENEAYPLFIGLSRFALQIFEYDNDRNEYVIYPDISPEQGPLAHNTVITVASVKYMLQFTLKAAEILQKNDDILDDIRRLLKGLPKYPTVTDEYGERFIDSEDAPKNMWIRHPSMLMPIFPTGEININSDEKLIRTALNTVSFLEENCEIGVFQVSWLSAVCARLGNGQRALRLLYEMGLDHMLRSNGLSAEVTERFMNYCLIMRQPLYYPCMMEFTGELLAAINEMLLGSDNGIIRIFPAMPTGDKEYDRLIRHGFSQSEFDDRFNTYPAWKDVRFDKLLARGAIEVSASLKNGEIEFIKIKSLKGGKVRITSPFSLNAIAECTDNVITLDTEAGKEYVWGNYTEKKEEDNTKIDRHVTYTKRQISIGEDENSGYQKALDSFTRSWYLGNMRFENHNVYKFDFGFDYEKDYSKEILRQSYCAEKMCIGTLGFNRLSDLEFTVKRGFGFVNAKSISPVRRNGPDLLREDLLEGEEKVSFLIEAPKGQYELFVVSGDEDEESVTLLNCDEGRKCGGEIIKKGSFQYKVIPLVHENDGNIKLDISTKKGKKWKLNYILMNLHKQL